MGVSNQYNVCPGDESFGPTNVWESNLEIEMGRLMEAITKYPYIAMVSCLFFCANFKDTEFPGVCYSNSGEATNIFDYGILRDNVNKLKLIQLGITLCTEEGEVAPDYPTWQFNFQFDIL